MLPTSIATLFTGKLRASASLIRERRINSRNRGPLALDTVSIHPGASRGPLHCPAISGRTWGFPLSALAPFLQEAALYFGPTPPRPN